MGTAKDVLVLATQALYTAKTLCFLHLTFLSRLQQARP